MNGHVCAFLAFLIWGLFPLYFRHLQAVPAWELVAHRIVWSCLLLFVVLTLRKNWRAVLHSFLQWRILVFHLFSAAMIGTNWFLYVWAVNHDQVLASSLGYFLNPLLNIVLGVLFFREKLHFLQWFAVGLAAFGIAFMAYMEHLVPWIALGLAFSFGAYGIMKKIAPVPSAHGLWLETLLLSLPAGYLLFSLGQGGSSGWQSVDLLHKSLLAFSGVVTVVPTLLFALATTRIPLSTLGFLQFLTPTVSFLLGVFLYNEPFPLSMRIAFFCIWIALILVSLTARRRVASTTPLA